MKTTLEIDDDLYREAEAYASLTGDGGLASRLATGTQNLFKSRGITKACRLLRRGGSSQRNGPSRCHRPRAPRQGTRSIGQAMNSIAVDTGVWVAAQDPDDPLCASSRRFLSQAISLGLVIHAPAFALVETACALSRKLRDATKGQHPARLIFEASAAKQHPVTASLLAKSIALGTSRFLRGGDALYVATAESPGCPLVSWDKEHIKRAGAVSPEDWMVANPPS